MLIFDLHSYYVLRLSEIMLVIKGISVGPTFQKNLAVAK